MSVSLASRFAVASMAISVAWVTVAGAYADDHHLSTSETAAQTGSLVSERP
jgi:hypothetical protein